MKEENEMGACKRIFLFITAMLLVMSFPWLAFFPIMEQLASKEEER